MNKWAARHLVYLPTQRLLGQDLGRHLGEVEGRERLSVEEILSIRDRRIRLLVEHACRQVPYYRELFDSLGIGPETVQSYADLVKLPVLTKRHILERPADLLAPAFPGRLFERKTSGSTGPDPRLQEGSRCTGGQRRGHVPLLCAGRHRDWRPTGEVLGCPGCSEAALQGAAEGPGDQSHPHICLRHFLLEGGEEVRRILKFGPAYFYGYTSAIYGFAIVARRLGLDLEVRSISRR